MLAGGEWTPASGHSTFIPTSKSTGFSLASMSRHTNFCECLLTISIVYWFFVGNCIAFLMYVKIKLDVNLLICLQTETPVTQIETNIHTEPEHVH